MYANMDYRRNPDFCTTNLCLSLSITNETKYKNMINLDYALIRKEIEAQVCKEHGLHPEFVKTDDGFGIKACCEPFRIELGAKSEKMIEEETIKILTEMMKGIE
ncbi:hypothetical protein DRF57_16870 [Chryseobacterium rhizosphaerae]|uniref:Uncharacterized protein n=3 Tax=Chryseobacterium rhizosphaerae TaxID=395937 RepID=A0ABX9IHZ8_9FLAO|nr:hypothetical protein DRF57_16870 [Chryseobacterium rhizosphaerae]GEN69475.1 hypothetical protein CRH01_40430 [Chryseobacterium rhizosphaerae]